MLFTSKVTMDLLCRGAMPRLDAVQSDANSRAVEFSLLADGTPWPIPAQTQGQVHCIRPDGTGMTYSRLADGSPACTMDGNTVTAYLLPEVLEQAGPVMLSVGLCVEDSTWSTFSVLLDVQPGIPETLMEQA